MHGQSVKELAQSALYPKESPAKIKNSSKRITIGLPKEVSLLEKRIALTPDAVALLVNNGHEIIVEKDAGKDANFTDSEYQLAGGQIVDSAREVFDAEIILKIEPLTDEEFDYLRQGQTLISTLNPVALSKNYFKRLNDKKVTGIAFEYIEDKVGDIPIIRAMSEIAGSSVMLIAAEYLSNANQGRGIILGGVTGVPPTCVVIIGAGTVGEYAARAALGLGAEIKVFDSHVYRMQRLKYAVGQNIYTSIIDSVTLSNALKHADVVVAAMRSDSGRSPLIVTEEMVMQMKPNSVIIDVSIDQGGCVETSEITTLDKPAFMKHDVIHYGVPNITSRVAHTASLSLSNIFTPFLLKTGKQGGISEMIYANQWFMKGVYSYRGSITKYSLAQKYDLRYRDLGLLIAAGM
jgi:alanine dehydrogenase